MKMFCISLSDGMQARKKVFEFRLGKKIGSLSEEWKSKISLFEKEHLPEKWPYLSQNRQFI
jgi:hypothetical protein